MPPRKPKVHPPKGRKRTKIERARLEFRALHTDFSIERLIQWYNEDCENPPRRGRPRRIMSWFKPLSEPVQLNRPRRKKRRIAILVWREI
jgi:hypothetical protein